MDGVVSAVQMLTLTDGRAMCARRWGASDSGTVVALHGLLDCSEGWASLGERLGCSQLALDLPGFGRSDGARRGSIGGYAHDVVEALGLLGVERFTLVGHSLGGAVATAVAELLPRRVDSLVLLAPAGFGRIYLAEAISVPGVRTVVQAGMPFALGSRLAVTAAYATMVTNGTLPERAVVRRVNERRRSLVDGAREGTRAVVEAGRGADAFHRRRVRYAGPVRAIWGDQDRLVPVSHAKGLQRALPQAHVEVWKGMGHHPLGERFDDLAALVERTTARAAQRRPRAPGLRRAA